VVTINVNIQSKVKNRDITLMFVRYSVHHANDVFRIMSFDTKSIIQSRDIIYLHEAYHDWIEKKVLQKKEIHDDEDEDDDDDAVANSKIQEVNDGQDILRIAQDQQGYVSVRKQFQPQGLQSAAEY
jgi:hypothetical protein